MNWTQLRTIFWVRWRLSRNQWRRGGKLNGVLTWFFLALGSMAAVAGGVGGLYAGGHLLNGSPLTLLWVWDGVIAAFLFFWLIGILSEIQRSEAIDLAKLLHLPISARDVFLINYLASLFTPSIILLLPGMVGLALGLTVSWGPSMLLLLPLLLGFLFMITAWTYCLRGWLVGLMVNKRRRRTIITGIGLAAILLGQAPNLILNSPWLLGRQRAERTHRSSLHQPPSAPFYEEDMTGPGRGQPLKSTLPKARQASGFSGNSIPPEVLAIHQYVPPAWVGNGALALASQNFWPAIWGTFGALAIGGLGVWRAYRVTNRFYQGHENARTVSQPLSVAPVRPGRKSLVERSLPWLSEEVSALTLVFFRSLLRAPEIKMTLLTPFIMLFLIASMQMSRGLTDRPEVIKPFMATGAVAFSLMGMIQLMTNVFGFDRDGFRALVLLPVRRRDTLLAKNICLLPIAFSFGALFLTILGFALRLKPTLLAAGLFQIGTAFLFVSMLGNWISIVAPYRIAAGSLKPTKTGTSTAFLIFFLHLLFPLAVLPVFLPALLEWGMGLFGWRFGLPVNLIASMVLLGAALWAYRFSLGPLGEMLERREKDILRVVTQEIE